MKEKTRLDLLLLELGLFPSREQARAAIMAGEVLVDEIKIDKAGAAVNPKANIRLLGDRLPFVSRGGLKLAKAAESFALDFQDKIVLDIGASTGGFTDCALQKGAAKVYAVDVGYNQLDWKLRSDERVIVLERINARNLDENIILEPVDILVADVSFISLSIALPPAIEKLLKPGGEIAVLIKPQFEAGRDAVGKGGIVRDRAVHSLVINNVMTNFRKLALAIQGLDFSPITGADGNIEYLLHAVKSNIAEPEINVETIIEAAWNTHKKAPV